MHAWMCVWCVCVEYVRIYHSVWKHDFGGGLWHWIVLLVQTGKHEFWSVVLLSLCMEKVRTTWHGKESPFNVQCFSLTENLLIMRLQALCISDFPEALKPDECLNWIFAITYHLIKERTKKQYITILTPNNVCVYESGLLPNSRYTIIKFMDWIIYVSSWPVLFHKMLIICIIC